MVGVYTTHLSLEESARNVQVRELEDYLFDHTNEEDFSLLCGDFNAEPQEIAVKYITSRLRDLHDEWRQSDESISEYTFSTDFTRRKRIDYILLQKNSPFVSSPELVDFRIIRSQAEQDHTKDLAMSDHYAQFARLRID